MLDDEVNVNHDEHTKDNPAVPLQDVLRKQDDNETVTRSELDPVSYLQSWNPLRNSHNALLLLKIKLTTL